MGFPESESQLATLHLAKGADEDTSLISGLDMLRNPGMSCVRLAQAIPELGKLDPEALARVDIEGNTHIPLLPFSPLLNSTGRPVYTPSQAASSGCPRVHE